MGNESKTFGCCWYFLLTGEYQAVEAVSFGRSRSIIDWFQRTIAVYQGESRVFRDFNPLVCTLKLVVGSA